MPHLAPLMWLSFPLIMMTMIATTTLILYYTTPPMFSKF